MMRPFTTVPTAVPHRMLLLFTASHLPTEVFWITTCIWIQCYSSHHSFFSYLYSFFFIWGSKIENDLIDCINLQFNQGGMVNLTKLNHGSEHFDFMASCVTAQRNLSQQGMPNYFGGWECWKPLEQREYLPHMSFSVEVHVSIYV